LNDGGVFGRIFVAKNYLFGTAAMGKPVHGRNRFTGSGAGAGGLAGWKIVVGIHVPPFATNFRRPAAAAYGSFPVDR
jgi:hypothetical protein